MNSYEEFMEQLHVGTLLKALSISNDIKHVTIGPSSKSYKNEANNEIHSENTSQDEILTQKSLNFQSSSHVNDLIVSNSINHTIKNLDQDRSKKVQQNMEKRLKTFSEFNNLMKINLEKYKENIQKDIKSKVLWEENQIFQQMKEHEQKLEQEKILQEQKIANRMRKRKQLIEEEILREQKEAEQKIIIDAEEQKIKKEIRSKLFIQLFSLHQQFTKDSSAILELIKQYKDDLYYKEFFKNSKHLAKLKHLSDQMDLLIKQCKDGDVNESDVKTASAILDQIKSTSTEISDDINKLKSSKSQTLIKSSSEVKEKSATNDNKFFDLSRVQKQTIKEESPSHKVQNDYEKHLFAKFHKFKRYLQEYEESFEGLLTDPSLKKFRKICQTSVIVPVNAISAESASHIRDKYNRLKKLLAGGNVVAARTSFSANTHPKGIPYCKYLLAKELVIQGEVVVSSKSEAAHPIASIALTLWADFPDFGHLLEANFYLRCPYLVPVILSQSEGQSNLNYYKMLGYLVDEKGTVEPQEKFVRRMSGLMRLYSAIIVAHPKLWHPFGIKNALDWLQTWLNQDPILDISATLLFDLFEIAGYTLFLEFKQVFWNLLNYTKNVYLPRIHEITDNSMLGPVIRLEKFLSNVLTTGKLSPPAGYLGPHFW